jgi:hypothetical protein
MHATHLFVANVASMIAASSKCVKQEEAQEWPGKKTARSVEGQSIVTSTSDQ